MLSILWFMSVRMTSTRLVAQSCLTPWPTWWSTSRRRALRRCQVPGCTSDRWVPLPMILSAGSRHGSTVVITLDWQAGASQGHPWCSLSVMFHFHMIACPQNCCLFSLCPSFSLFVSLSMDLFPPFSLFLSLSVFIPHIYVSVSPSIYINIFLSP